jgi:hypothetical protein
VAELCRSHCTAVPCADPGLLQETHKVRIESFLECDV